VLGMGFAATRDINSFFRYAAADDFGTPNPLAHGDHARDQPWHVAVGNFIKTFIHLGFHEDEWDASSGGRVAITLRPVKIRRFSVCVPGGGRYQ